MDFLSLNRFLVTRIDFLSTNRFLVKRIDFLPLENSCYKVCSCKDTGYRGNKTNGVRWFELKQKSTCVKTVCILKQNGEQIYESCFQFATWQTLLHSYCLHINIVFCRAEGYTTRIYH
jgi:hypothetical protein